MPIGAVPALPRVLACAFANLASSTSVVMAIPERAVGTGAFSFTVTSSGPVTLTPPTCWPRAEVCAVSAEKCSMLHATSCAVISAPLENLTPDRSL